MALPNPCVTIWQLFLEHQRFTCLRYVSHEQCRLRLARELVWCALVSQMDWGFYLTRNKDGRDSFYSFKSLKDSLSDINMLLACQFIVYRGWIWICSEFLLSGSNSLEEEMSSVCQPKWLRSLYLSSWIWYRLVLCSEGSSIAASLPWFYCFIEMQSVLSEKVQVLCLHVYGYIFQ